MVVTSAIVTFTLNVAQQYLDDVENTPDKSVARCQKYLNAAAAVIEGMYNEPVDIIISAMYCDFSKQEEIDAIMKRIDEYFKLERLRPILNIAIEGLNGYLEELKRDRYQLVNLLFGRNDEATVDNFENLLKDLKSYYDKLDEEAIKWRNARTGLLVIPLQRIRDSLAKKDKQEVIAAANTPQIADEQRRLSDLNGKIAKTTNELILAFAKK
jgi:hypothetical protein